jgi:outer membrane lipoprotein-sorting protein
MNHLTRKGIQYSLTINLLLFLFSSFLLAAPTPEEMLRRTYQDENDVQFVGTLETTDFTSFSSATVKIFQKGNWLRMEYQLQDGASFVILDDGKAVYRLDEAKMTAYESFVEKPPKRLDLLFENYQLKLLSIEKLLGRQTALISIEPKHHGNPQKKVWIDQRTAVILRMELFRSDGKKSSESFYTNIDFDAEVPAEIFKLPQGFSVVRTEPKTSKRLSRTEIRRAVGFEILEPRSLPEGYILDGFYLSYCPMGMPIVHLRYFDGLNSISLFEHPINCMEMGGSMMERMMCWMRGRKRGCGVLQEKHGIAKSLVVDGLICIFVGNLSERQLQQMAESLE